MNKRKYKILFVAQNLGCGGAPRTMLNVIRNLDRDKFEPILFLVEKRGEFFREVPDDIAVFSGIGLLRYKKYYFPYCLVKLLTHAKKSDVIIGASEFGKRSGKHPA